MSVTGGGDTTWTLPELPPHPGEAAFDPQWATPETASDLVSPFAEIDVDLTRPAEDFESDAPTLRLGSRGTAVRRLQAALTAAGHPVAVDGDFGARTQAALRAFQTRAGLTVDGVAGPSTWSRLAAPPAPAPAGDAGGPGVPLGTLVLRTPTKSMSYPFTAEDLVWTAKLLVHEAGGRDDPDNAAVLWAMFNRYALFTHRTFPTFSAFVRAYSTTLQPVLRSSGAAARHMHRPPSEFVRTGGTYPGTDIPRGQLRRHLDIQRAPWSSVKPAARELATRALTGRLPNPGIGLASEFASTRIYFRQHFGRDPSQEEWRRYTMDLAARKRWRWIGDVAGLDQTKNAFFLDLRAADLPSGAVRVLPPGAADGESGEAPWEHGEWEIDDVESGSDAPGQDAGFEDDEGFAAESPLDRSMGSGSASAGEDAELESLAAVVARALRSQWPALREHLTSAADLPLEGESRPDNAKEVIRASGRMWGTDEAAIMSALRSLLPSEMAELCADPSIVSLLLDELSGADLAAAAAQLARGRVGSMPRTELARIVAAPGRHTLGTLAAAYARDELLAHREAVDRTGVGTVHGNQCPAPRPAGARAADCTSYALDVIGKAFAAKGRQTAWNTIRDTANRQSGGRLKGTELLKALQALDGWQAVFWAPDPRNPQDGQSEHPFAYRKVREQGTYYGIPVDTSKSIVNYRRTNAAHPTDMTGIEHLRRLQFGALATRGGLHMAVIVNGDVHEVHWEKPATDRDAIEATPLERFAWQSGVISAPRDDLARAWRTP